MAKEAQLTPRQQSDWNRHGYIVVENAIPHTTCDELYTALMQRYGALGGGAWLFTEFQTFRLGRGFQDLIDCPATLGIVLELLGDDIRVMSTQHVVKFRADHDIRGWHSDGGAYPLARGVAPLLQLKICYALHDVDTPGMGNFTVAPGSHLLPHTDLPAAIDEHNNISGSVEVLQKKGDAILFHQALWHTSGNNLTDQPRVNLFYAYVPIWMMPFDVEAVNGLDDATLDTLSHPQRRLLEGRPPGDVRRWYLPPERSLREELNDEPRFNSA